MWLDPQKQQCLILWRKIEEWSQLILGWAATYGVSDSVMLLEDLSSGDDVRGTGEQSSGCSEWCCVRRGQSCFRFRKRA